MVEDQANVARSTADLTSQLDKAERRAKEVFAAETRRADQAFKKSVERAKAAYLREVNKAEQAFNKVARR